MDLVEKKLINDGWYRRDGGWRKFGYPVMPTYTLEQAININSALKSVSIQNDLVRNAKKQSNNILPFRPRGR